MSDYHQRALFLLEARRYSQAEAELRKGLADDPQDSIAQGMLAACLEARGAYEEATAAAHEAIRLDPEEAYGYYVAAVVETSRNRLDEAERAILRALELDSEDADYFSCLARIRFGQDRYDEMLAAAEHGLEIDADDEDCRRYRAAALRWLGRVDEARQAGEANLRDFPDEALVHADYGWTLIDAGEPARSLNHFREALRLEPELVWARDGVAEALRRRFAVYRLVSAYNDWIAEIDWRGRLRLAAVILFVLTLIWSLFAFGGARFSFLAPVLIALSVVCMATWYTAPLCDLLLLLHPQGKHALGRDRRAAAVATGACLASSAVILLLYFQLHRISLLLLAASTFALAPPIILYYRCSPGWPRRRTLRLLLLTFLCAAATTVTAAVGELVPGRLGILCLLAATAGLLITVVLYFATVIYGRKAAQAAVVR